MKNNLRRICIIFLILIMIAVCGCKSAQESNSIAPSLAPVEEVYDYSAQNAFYSRPAFTNQGTRRDVLKASTEDGLFFCFTEDTALADDFINAQRTLLQFLKSNGVALRELSYFATDYDDSFSDSDEDDAFIALSAAKTYRQILVTLQALWGDYTDYGYIYALSNAIADELGWQTDSHSTVEHSDLNTFFTNNPDAIHLLYPSFSLSFASEETVNNCKSLSIYLFKKIAWNSVLEKPIDIQLDDYRTFIANYAGELGISFTRHACGYAYSGEYLPLRILTTYAQLIIDQNYFDYYTNNGQYFDDYVSIYQTASVIDQEISDAVSYFDLEDRAGTISINWLSAESAEIKHGKQLVNFYKPALQEVTVTTITAYLHEYYHHLEHLLNPTLGQCWQQQAFCEIGRSHSVYSLQMLERAFTQDENWANLFIQCTGRNYQANVNDYFETYDILCYVTNEFELDYYTGRNGINSFIHYLIDLCGEDVVYQVMLFPETVHEYTEKTWDELEADWKDHIQDKFKDIAIPEWVESYM